MSERPPAEELPPARRRARVTPKRIVITVVSVVVVVGGGGFVAYQAVQNANRPPQDPVFSIQDMGKIASGDLYAPDPETDVLKAEAEQAYRADKLRKGRSAGSGKDLDWVIPKQAPASGDFPAKNFPPGSDPSPGSNKATAKAMLADYGFDSGQWGCLELLWQKESGWNERAMNRYSGAYGIPQSLPGSKMASVGADWQTNAATQIKWGLNYIKGRYGTPCGAWGHSQASGWY